MESLVKKISEELKRNHPGFDVDSFSTFRFDISIPTCDKTYRFYSGTSTEMNFPMKTRVGDIKYFRKIMKTSSDDIGAFCNEIVELIEKARKVENENEKTKLKLHQKVGFTKIIVESAMRMFPKISGALGKTRASRNMVDYSIKKGEMIFNMKLTISDHKKMKDFFAALEEII